LTHADADKPGSEVPHYHAFQEERVVVKQGKLGYFIGHQHHVQSAEADKEVVVKPGVRDRGSRATRSRPQSGLACSVQLFTIADGATWHGEAA
jgi:hypothetical protein